MFGAQYFGVLVLGAAVAIAPTQGTASGGLGSTYFGQYTPGINGEQPAPPTPTPSQSSGGLFPLRNNILLYKSVKGTGEGSIGPLDGEAVGRVANPISAEASGSLSALALSAAPEVTPYDFTEQGQQDLASILLSL